MANPQLVGAELHGFNNLLELRTSVTMSYDLKQWFSNEENTAILLNPVEFSWPQGAPLVDRAFTTDCYSYAATPQQLQAMAVQSGPRAVMEGLWSYYYTHALIPGVFKEEKLVGIKKNNVGHRRPDSEEVICQRFEVKGDFRCRRRTVLPENFEAVAHYPNPHPGLSVVQYQLCPSALAPYRAGLAAIQEAELNTMRQQVGEQFLPLHGGPVRPPGVLNHSSGWQWARARGPRGRGPV